MSLGALIEKFRVVALDRVEKMNLLMIQLERDLHDSAVIEELMREVHTLKGEANMMGFADINLVAHQVEHVLLAITAPGAESDRVMNDLVFEGLDMTRQLLTKTAGGEERPVDLAGFVDRVALARIGEDVHASDTREVFEGAFEEESLAEVSLAEVSVAGAVESEPSLQEASSWERAPVDAPASGFAGSGTGGATRTRIESAGVSAIVVDGKSGEGNAAGGMASQVQGLRIQGGGSLRVDLDKLEELGDIAADVLLLSRRFEHRLSVLEEIRRAFRGWLSASEGQLPKGQQVAARNLMHRLDAFETMLGEEAYLVSTRAGHLDEQTRRLRHVPLAQVLSHYPRAVRDLASAQGKRIRMVHVFGEVEVDRAVLTALSEPLLHLIRNAVDHGIESPAERLQAGKEEEGEIGLLAEYVGDGIQVVLYDDGRGIDPAVIRKKALARGLLNAEQAREMSDQEVIALIFEAGFTTRDVVSDVSGRGIGMDVVRRQISQLGGYIEVESEIGHGTRFVLHLPLSSAVNSILMILIGGHRFAVAANDVERVETVVPGDVRRVHGGMNVYSGRELIPLVDWAGLLGVGSRARDIRAESGEFRVLIVKKGTRKAAVWIDEVIGEREAISRPLGEFLSGVGLCQAVALTAASEVVPMLNVLELLMRPGSEVMVGSSDGGGGAGRRLASGEGAGEDGAGQKTVLVVEDSDVTRALVTSILRDEGYRVLEAGDGAQGWRVLGGGERVDLVLTDVQMPQMDGLELLRSIRSSEELAGVPVLVLSMLGEPEDKERAMELGANGYLVKMNFEEKELLRSVRRWL